jgi:hypothetical protein
VAQGILACAAPSPKLPTIVIQSAFFLARRILRLTFLWRGIAITAPPLLIQSAPSVVAQAFLPVQTKKKSKAAGLSCVFSFDIPSALC